MRRDGEGGTARNDGRRCAGGSGGDSAALEGRTRRVDGQDPTRRAELATRREASEVKSVCVEREREKGRQWRRWALERRTIERVRAVDDHGEGGRASPGRTGLERLQSRGGVARSGQGEPGTGAGSRHFRRGPGAVINPPCRPSPLPNSGERELPRSSRTRRLFSLRSPPRRTSVALPSAYGVHGSDSRRGAPPESSPSQRARPAPGGRQGNAQWGEAFRRRAFLRTATGQLA